MVFSGAFQMRTWLGEVTTKFPLIVATIPSKGPRGAELNQKKVEEKWMRKEAYQTDRAKQGGRFPRVAP